MKMRSNEEERQGENGCSGGRMRTVTGGMTPCSCSLGLWSLRCKTITKALSLSLPLLLAFRSLSLSLSRSLCRTLSCGDYVINMCSVQRALQVFNITPFPLRDEAMQSSGAVPKNLFYTASLHKVDADSPITCCG